MSLYRAARFNRYDLLSPEESYRLLRARLALTLRIPPGQVDDLPLLDAADVIAYDNALKLLGG